VLAGYTRKTNIGVGMGIVLEIVGRIMVHNPEPMRSMGSIIMLVGLVAFIWGCAQYAKGKGHSPWFGLFGLLSIIGLIVLALFRDKHKVSEA
jgi:uncharacterized membrane protein